MPGISTLQDLLSAVIERGSRWIEPRAATGDESLIELCAALNSTRGEASGVVIASRILAGYGALDAQARRQFFLELAERFDPDPERISAAAEGFARDGSPQSLAVLTAAVEPPRQELLRRLNQAPGGTAALVSMRAELLRLLRDEPTLQRIDDDFSHLLHSWFNRGFLVMRRIDWSSPADLLEKIIDYEAVHEIADWHELRRRLQPGDRRCYAFFHPAMPDEPLVFVEVALTGETPNSIADLLCEAREPLAAEDADTAVFYAISNCQRGLRGVSFGHFLIKQVASDLARDLPNLKTFVTLSPVPGFGPWLHRQARARAASRPSRLLEIIASEGWRDDATLGTEQAQLAAELAADYFLHQRRDDGSPIDPVARFHLGNGAVLEAIHPQANLSTVGLQASAGVMVNYRYDLARIEENHEAYATRHELRASRAVQSLAGKPHSHREAP